ncbi:MAG: SUMF1/EgtB/PvdO family nonheme iron enzyme [Planctomycetota bacterium]|jgi:formylglycine-generating enzyme required for sulfatase activity
MREAWNGRAALTVAVAALVPGSCGDDGELTIVAQPTHQMPTEGEDAVFSIAATGVGILSYQWKRDGVEIPGETGSSYTLSPTVLADDGATFTCVVSDAGGEVETAPATLWVSPAGLAYKVIDIPTSGVSESDTVADLLSNAAYKTTKLVLKRVPGGTFLMGDQVGAWGGADELPVHRVNIAHAFYMGVFEVTERQYYEVIGSPVPTNDAYPKAFVTMGDCSTFLSQLASAASESLRLPTEAEWEYICKAGTSTDFSYGNTPDPAYMWYDVGLPNEVGTKLANPWGLHDMHGNVWEFCSDWYDAAYYSSSPENDPQGPATGTFVVNRGGSWAGADLERSSERIARDPAVGDSSAGFRAVIGP